MHIVEFIWPCCGLRVAQTDVALRSAIAAGPCPARGRGSGQPHPPSWQGDRPRRHRQRNQPPWQSQGGSHPAPSDRVEGGLNMGVFYRIYKSSLPIVRTHTYILYKKTLQQKPNYTVHEHRRTLEYFCSECFCFATFVECSLDILLFFFTCGEADRS